MMPSHAGNGARPRGCQECRRTDAHIATSGVACTILHATVVKGTILYYMPNVTEDISFFKLGRSVRHRNFIV